MPNISLALKALSQLNPGQLLLYALYKILLRSGYLRWNTRARQLPQLNFHPIFKFPDSAALKSILGDDGLAQVREAADEIVGGRVRLFGGAPAPLILVPPRGVSAHWTAYERGEQTWEIEDPKFIWEPARFGWAFSLGRAYWLTKDESYSNAFWGYAESFWDANPVNIGPNWVSAQEVALRLMALVFAAQIFDDSEYTTPERRNHLTKSIAEHAARIPASLIYARAQNNNHLLSEAVGLITASRALPDHPDARRWQKLGWRWYTWGIDHQISADGAYMQNSANYHRLILQLALWLYAMAETQIPAAARDHLAAATSWLLKFSDPQTGRVPNLGPNDGAYILPLTTLPFHDYRPVLSAASSAFLDVQAFEPGLWDEMNLWFSCRLSSDLYEPDLPLSGPAILHNKANQSWAYLRTAQFIDRPGHADQLHLDLWWRGHNIAQDAGTFRYTAAPPWENALTHSAVHNTLTVENHEQMTRAGRFLYLDWAQASILDRSENTIVAEHNGYRRLGLTHRRMVITHTDGSWIVEDTLIPISASQSGVTSRLHWMLPDWEWQIDDRGLVMKLLSPYGRVVLKINIPTQSSSSNFHSSIVRAGKLLYGTESISSTRGWVSPTYGEKVPALSFAIDVENSLPIKFLSTWKFPDV